MPPPLFDLAPSLVYGKSFSSSSSSSLTFQVPWDSRIIHASRPPYVPPPPPAKPTADDDEAAEANDVEDDGDDHAVEGADDAVREQRWRDRHVARLHERRERRASERAAAAAARAGDLAAASAEFARAVLYTCQVRAGGRFGARSGIPIQRIDDPSASRC